MKVFTTAGDLAATPVTEHYFTWIKSGAVSGRLGFHGRQADDDHADDRHRHRLADSYLRDRIHGARRGLLSLLRLPEPVHVFHAEPGAGGELSDSVRRLGRRRPVQLSADRVLLRKEERDHRRQQGVHREPHRRLRLLARHVPDRGELRNARFHPGLLRRARQARPER